MKKGQLRKLLVCVMVFAMIISQGTVFGYNDSEVEEPVIVNTDGPGDIDTNVVDGDTGESTEPGDDDDDVVDPDDGDDVDPDDGDDDDVVDPDDDGDDVDPDDSDDDDVAGTDDDGDDADPDNNGGTAAPDDGIDIEDEDTPEGELSDEDADELDEEEEAEVLEYQMVAAVIYTDETCEVVQEDDETVITVTGELPVDAYINAYAVAVEITLEENVFILAAYDIKIYREDGTVFEPETAVDVVFESPVFGEAEAVDVYHMEDEYAEPELVATDIAPVETQDELQAVAFIAESFSIYIVTSSNESETNVNISSNANTIQIHVGDRLNLNSSYTNGTHSWSVSNTSIASITSNGNRATLVALQTGTITITHKYGTGGNSTETSALITILPRVTTVDTIDSTALGVNIWMTNHAFTTATAKGYLGTAGDYGNGSTKLNLVQRNLVNGFPVAVNGANIRTLFDGAAVSGTSNQTYTANNLFIKEEYEQTGYLYFNSAEYFAQLNSTTANTIFTVYNALGTPSSASNYFYQRGNFMPYNTLNVNPTGTNANKIVNFNKYSDTGTALPTSDPRYNEALYGFTNSNVFNFGMHVKANFFQPKDGKVLPPNETDITKAQPMIFDFTGDDDMWVFIDGVLVLDLGGVHDAQTGSIDFSTGVVKYTMTQTGGNPIWMETTIRDQFEEAGKSSTYISDNFNTSTAEGNINTFKNYKGHTIDVFYMERGAGASNLKIRFNLPTQPKGKLSITKVVEGIDPSFVNDQDYQMKLYLVINNTPVLQTNKSYVVYKDGSSTPVSGNTGETGIFKLKHGEQAVFSDIADGQKFFVEEIELDEIKEHTGVEYSISTGEGGEDNPYTNNDSGVSRSKLYTYNYNDANSVYFMVTNKVDNPEEVICHIDVTKAFNGTSDGSAPYYFDANFILRMIKYKDGTPVPDANQFVRIVNFRTGGFVLKDGKYHYTFEGLLHGTYIIEEVIVGNGDTTLLQYKKTTFQIDNGGYANGMSATVEIVNTDPDYEESAAIDFINHYGPVTVDLTILKVNEDEIELEGAEFTLYLKNGSGIYEEVIDGVYTTDTDGKVTITGLNPGEYMLVETKAPDGYIEMTEPLYFVVDANLDIKLTDEDITSGDASLSEEDPWILTIVNHRLVYELPLTGGIGTTIFTIAGIAIIGAALVSIVIYFRRGGRKKAKTGK